MYNRIRNTVDSPSGDPENEPELANATVETTLEGEMRQLAPQPGARIKW